MGFDFPEALKKVHLTTVCGVGELGKQVFERLKPNLELLPQPARDGVSVGSVESLSMFEEHLNCTRAKLTRVETVNEILRQGWDVMGRDVGRVFVRHVIILDVDEIVPDGQNLLSELAGRWPSDRIHLITGCSSVDEALDQLDRELPGSLVIVGEKLSNGLTVGSSSLAAAVAGYLLLMLLPETSKRLDDNKQGPMGIGLAGFQGLAGASLGRLADLIALGVLETHLGNDRIPEDTSSLEKPLQQFVDDYSPRQLGMRLFDSRLFVELHPNPIPASIEWKGETLDVKLDRGKIALQLAEGEERGWSAQIRRFSRGFDMSLAAVWRQKLERVAETLVTKVTEAFPVRFRNLLEGTAYAPVLIDRMLNALDEELTADRSPMKDATEDLEEALKEMDGAIKQRPNMMALAGRMALWLIPALLGLPAFISGLYEPARAWLFSGVVVVAGFAGAGGWLLHRYLSARRKVLRSRDKAIDTLVLRQEALLSENAVGCLRDVAATVAHQAADARQLLKRYVKNVEKAIETLKDRTNVNLPESPVMTPVLTTPEQYFRLLEDTNVDSKRWLLDAVNVQRFGKLSTNMENSDISEWLKSMESWCRERIADGVAIKTPTYGDLWRIRMKTLGSYGIPKTLEEFYNQAVLLADHPIMGSPEKIILVPKILVADVLEVVAEFEEYSADDVIESMTVPLMCCLQRWLLQDTRRGRGGRS